MKGADGSPLNIIKRVAAGNYTTFGMCLLQDVNGDKVKIIETDYRHKGAEAVTEAIIQKWLKSGRPTYEHLTKCLNQSGLGTLAKLIAENYVHTTVENMQTRT